MFAEIITTGEEVLSGQIVDSNASWLSEWLRNHGFDVRRRLTVGDRMEDLEASFSEASQRADIVFVNGGLGPTTDDLTAEAAGRAAGEDLVKHDSWIAEMERKYAQMGREMSPRNLKQAMLPESAKIIDNPIGTACGFSMKINRAVFYFTPGPPSELKKMVREVIAPDLQSTFDRPGRAFQRKFHSFGLPEAKLNQELDVLNLPEGVSLGFRVHFPLIEIKLHGFSNDPHFEDKVARAERDAREVLGDFVIADGESKPAEALQELMIERGFSLALAESCTGGMLASLLVEIPGSSAYFDRGFVTYTNAAKTACLGVPAAVIDLHGAVSLETARLMAAGARRAAGTTHALSITGVAGPDGGTDDKPVGMVCFALATPETVYSQTVQLPRWDRKRIRGLSAMVSLDMLRRLLQNRNVFGGFDYSRLAQNLEHPLETIEAKLDPMS
jgi:nicotinamide-nucleotide amidase